MNIDQFPCDQIKKLKYYKNSIMHSVRLKDFKYSYLMYANQEGIISLGKNEIAEFWTEPDGYRDFDITSVAVYSLKRSARNRPINRSFYHSINLALTNSKRHTMHYYPRG